MKKIFYILLAVLGLIPCNLIAQNRNYGKIALQVGPGGLNLFYADDYGLERKVVFPNRSQNDTTIIRQIRISKPTEIWSRIYHDGKSDEQSFLLEPGDSTKLILKDYAIRGDQSYNITPQEFLKFYTDWSITKPFKALSEFELINWYKETKDIFIENLRKIDELDAKHQITNATKCYFIEATTLDYFRRELSTIGYNDNYNPRLNKYLDTIIPRIKKYVLSISYNTPQIPIILNFITKHDLSKDHVNDADITAFANYVEGNGWGSYGLGLIFTKLDQYPYKSLPEVKAVLTNLSGKINADDKAITDSLLSVYSNRKFINSGKISIESEDGRRISLEEILTNNSNSYIVIDFWASWCIPCRAQIPFWKAASAKMKKRNIVFLTLSLDEDPNRAKWLSALQTEHIAGSPNSYRLINPKKSELIKFLSIQSIPRYILVAPGGKLINENFFYPTDQKFESEIAKAMTN